MPWARASALHRHLECGAASVLPRLDRGKWERGYLGPELTSDPGPIVDRSYDAADWGVAMHAAKAEAPDAQDPWLEWVSPWREKLWPSRLGQHEVAVSYDCGTKRFLTFSSPSESERTAWKEAQGPDCVTGTCDWWAELPSGEPWIDDLKTGWQKPEVITPQTLFYLLARVRLAEPGWSVGRVSITHWPRAKEPTEPSRSGLWRQVSLVALEAFEEDLQMAWRRATGPNPAARPGAHCEWCSSITICEAANR